MPLYILVPMILIGLPLTIGVVYWTRRGKAKNVLTDVQILTRFAEDFPAFNIREVIISDNGSSAFLLPNGSCDMGLIHAIGQNYLTRLLSRELVRHVKETSEGIDLYVNDLTLKQVAFPLADAGKRAKAMQKLSFK